MPTFLQPVELPERCFLQEVLMWVAFQRLPTARYTLDGDELRETVEVGGYAIDIIDDTLSDDETKRAGIPVDPSWPLHKDEKVTLSLSVFDEFLARPDLDSEHRKQLLAERADAEEYQQDVSGWRVHYNRAIEYPASQIFIALRNGTLRASGRKLSGFDRDEAIEHLNSDGQDVFDLPITDILPAFWSLQGIDFEASSAHNASDHYCHISFRTEEVLAVFPGQQEEVSGVSRVGDSFVLSEKTRVTKSRLPRGRPPYPWDAFHIEIADLIRRSELPKKKEAAIEHFKIWFLKEHGIAASRSVIGEKIKPYYDRFVRNNGQKIG